MPILWTSCLFLSALLLFWIQPLAAKWLLPRLGGTPQVWSTVVLFFQSALLLGYGYAFALSKFKLRWQKSIHLPLLLLSLLQLPLQFSLSHYFGQNYPLNIILSLGMSLALPMLLIAASAPLMQHWYSHTNNHTADDPYHLYAASNLGSVIALLGFIIVLEPQLGITKNISAWSLSYLILVFVIISVACNKSKTATSTTATDTKRPLQSLLTLLLSFTPASLMLGFTTHLTTDIAAVPLLWVLPLLIYLLTYILAFSRNSFAGLSTLTNLVPEIIAIQALLLPSISRYISGSQAIVIELLSLLVLALACHRRLYEIRPDKQQLTQFYLLIAIGGWLAGVLHSFIAPSLFTKLYELPLSIILALLIYKQSKTKLNFEDILIAVGFVLPISIVLSVNLIAAKPAYIIFAFLVAALVLVILFQRKPLSFALAMAALILPKYWFSAGVDHDILYQARNFFGVKTVLQTTALNANLLYSGTTLHGAQFQVPERRKELLTYYHPLNELKPVLKPNSHIGALGLGTGNVACLDETAQLDFYEIDPQMITTAKNPQLFSYLSSCNKQAKIIEGDARIELAKAAAFKYQLLIVDVFSSDSIPMHMLTVEAFATYIRHLSADGIIALHFSNRYLKLLPLLRHSAAYYGFNSFYLKSRNVAGKDMRMVADWLILTADQQQTKKLQQLPALKLLPEQPGFVFTDDYSNIIRILR